MPLPKLPVFRMQTSFLLITIVAILLAWRRDHTDLLEQMEQIRNPSGSWNTNDALGEPNTFSAGDKPTAWASQLPDSGPEWLLLEYEKAIKPTEVWVYETYNPGAVVKLTAFDDKGAEVVIWKGKDPTPTTASMGTSKIPVSVDFPTRRIKVYVDSMLVPGWNEIDAVGIVDAGGKKYWATKGFSSSAFGRNNSVPTNIFESVLEDF